MVIIDGQTVTPELAKQAPDYQQIYWACAILAAHEDEESQRNLNCEHDTLHICLYAEVDELDEEEKAVLEACGVERDDDLNQWQRRTSC